jgi:flavin reductase (DIM6/NTAB) family NADH-FMN oxidoreductase RutF
VDKFKLTKIKTQKSKFIKPPLLKDATLNLECKLYKEIKAGDHIIFIGKVLAAYANEEKKTLVNMGLINEKHIFKEF